MRPRQGYFDRIPQTASRGTAHSDGEKYLYTIATRWRRSWGLTTFFQIRAKRSLIAYILLAVGSTFMIPDTASPGAGGRGSRINSPEATELFL